MKITKAFFEDIRKLIVSARTTIARGVDLVQVHTNFEIGRRIVEQELLGEDRAAYGKEVMKALSERLTREFGKGFSHTNLKLMRLFYLQNQHRIGQSPTDQFGPPKKSQSLIAQFPIVQSLSGQLTRVPYPTPEELWNLTFTQQNAWRDRFAAVPFEDRGGYFQGRYYQDIAIERLLEAIAAGKQRILLTLATGTGKTFIAFQLAWKLFQSRWNLSGEPNRRPRILFLAARNILANQAYNAFSAFPEDAMVRIEPADIKKKGKVPKNGSLFFTIFQTFMCGPPKDGKPSPCFGE